METNQRGTCEQRWPIGSFTFLLQMEGEGGCDINQTLDQYIPVGQQRLQSLGRVLRSNLKTENIIYFNIFDREYLFLHGRMSYFQQNSLGFTLQNI